MQINQDESNFKNCFLVQTYANFRRNNPRISRNLLFFFWLKGLIIYFYEDLWKNLWKNLWKKLVEKTCEKNLWKKLVKKTCEKNLWKKLVKKLVKKIVKKTCEKTCEKNFHKCLFWEFKKSFIFSVYLEMF